MTWQWLKDPEEKVSYARVVGFIAIVGNLIWRMYMGKTIKHIGFKTAQKQIARREGISMKQAGAILASSTRKASPAAKRANPNLRKVRG